MRRYQHQQNRQFRLNSIILNLLKASWRRWSIIPRHGIYFSSASKTTVAFLSSWKQFSKVYNNFVTQLNVTLNLIKSKKFLCWWPTMQWSKKYQPILTTSFINMTVFVNPKLKLNWCNLMNEIKHLKYLLKKRLKSKKNQRMGRRK